MCYPVCGMIHIKETLLLKSSPCGGSGFPLSLSEWSFTICLTPYNRNENAFSASLNKTFSSFLRCWCIDTKFIQVTGHVSRFSHFTLSSFFFFFFLFFFLILLFSTDHNFVTTQAVIQRHMKFMQYYNTMTSCFDLFHFS